MAFPKNCTPLPWRHDIDEGEPNEKPRVYGGDGCLVAEVGNAESWLDHADRWAANAHLIAAAGKLYKALEAALDEYWSDHHADMSEAEFNADPLVMQMRAALAAARGEG